MADEKVPAVDVGRRLRQLREERKMSMRALARESGLSANALSMIERGKTSPSVSTLYKLATALGLPITAFFQETPEKEPIVFRNPTQRSRVEFPNGLWEGLGGEAFTGRVQPFLLTLEPGASSGDQDMVHTGHEFVLCLEGSLEYRVEGEPHLLSGGDSLLFAARLGHRWRNLSDSTTRAVFVLSGFQEYEQVGEIHIDLEP
jgi:transcriptional regulator with XRE-family HTH domain